MIISRQKPFDEIAGALGDNRRIFLIGCAKCATVCKSGGEEELWQMQENLAAIGKTTTGSLVVDEVCHMLRTQRDLRSRKDQIDEAEAVLVLSCGAGVQSVSAAVVKTVISGTDTLFLGNIRRFGDFDQRCSLCGHCILNETGGICPVTRCAKRLMNGPCGGMHNGKCELGSDHSCAWQEIYERLEALGRLDLLEKLFSPREAGRMPNPRNLKLERGR